jgi:hypothetical protein
MESTGNELSLLFDISRRFCSHFLIERVRKELPSVESIFGSTYSVSENEQDKILFSFWNDSFVIPTKPSQKYFVSIFVDQSGKVAVESSPALTFPNVSPPIVSHTVDSTSFIRLVSVSQASDLGSLLLSVLKSFSDEKLSWLFQYLSQLSYFESSVFYLHFSISHAFFEYSTICFQIFRRFG